MHTGIYKKNGLLAYVCVFLILRDTEKPTTQIELSNQQQELDKLRDCKINAYQPMQRDNICIKSTECV